GDPLARMRALGGPVRLEAADDADVLGLGPGHLLAAPVHTGTKVWGAVVAVRARGAFPLEAGERLQEYADLIATAIANAEDRVLLQRQAGRDPLTDLLNYRAFHERLADEVSRAQRHDRPLAVGIVDVDGFRELNDRVGTEDADAALVEIAARVREGVRDEDVVARLVSDRFGVIFVESDPAEAELAAERARSLVADRPLRHGLRASVSVGLCDLDRATVAEDLVRRAGIALEVAKGAGGDRVHRYLPEEAGLGVGARAADDLDRSHALLGLRALARAIDAKDPATEEHSDRVATLVTRLAAVRGWDDRAVVRLREAALLHDVGKIGVPDAILLKRGPLSAQEREVVQEHAALGAHMVAGVLEDDQVAWIAAHHERPDGAGYPARLHDATIPEGAALLAVADAWDLMTRARSYAPRRSVEDALTECRSLAGRQFCPQAVEALHALHERGELTLAAARLHAPEAA
ncbi:MAG TPA: HD domain-containing phosphohydrolase, partial [Solirubrobacteraceae bacterium]|nr:HD domain-containing phosphohydrolase [Solirubrobacteraceae bacterium]